MAIMASEPVDDHNTGFGNCLHSSLLNTEQKENSSSTYSWLCLTSHFWKRIVVRKARDCETSPILGASKPLGSKPAFCCGAVSSDYDWYHASIPGDMADTDRHILTTLVDIPYECRWNVLVECPKFTMKSAHLCLTTLTRFAFRYNSCDVFTPGLFCRYAGEHRGAMKS
jgi:hypothetical protein